MHFQETAGKLEEIRKVLGSLMPQDSVKKLLEQSLHSQGIAKIKEAIKPSREQMAEGAGVEDFIWRLWKVRHHPLLSKLQPHLEVLAASPTTSVVAPNKYTEKTFHDKLFELYFALLLLPLCRDIDLDDPVNSSKKSKDKKRPDIIASIDNKRWSFECKLLYSETQDRARAYITTMNKALEQLAQIPSVWNLAVIGFKNQVPMDELWPIENGEPKTWASDGEPYEILVSKSKTIRKSIEEDAEIRNGMFETFEKWNQGGILSYSTLNLFTGTTGIHYDNKSVIAVLKALQLWPFGEISFEHRVMSQRLNDQLHFL